MRILVVEDDSALREQMVEGLQDEGYIVDASGDGEEGLFFATENPLDLAVVDLGLPGISGVELIQKSRAAGKKFPILVLTARHRWQDKVEGLEAGADDYLVKPVHPEELKARVRALLRRSGGWSNSAQKFGPMTLDLQAQQALLDGQNVSLTTAEYRLLEYLALHPGKVVSKSELTEHLYADDDDRDSNVIEVFVRRLRKKLKHDIGDPIETLRGRGYRLVWATDAD